MIHLIKRFVRVMNFFKNNPAVFELAYIQTDTHLSLCNDDQANTGGAQSGETFDRRLFPPLCTTRETNPRPLARIIICNPIIVFIGY